MSAFSRPTTAISPSSSPPLHFKTRNLLSSLPNPSTTTSLPFSLPQNPRPIPLTPHPLHHLPSFNSSKPSSSLPLPSPDYHRRLLRLRRRLRIAGNNRDLKLIRCIQACIEKTTIGLDDGEDEVRLFNCLINAYVRLGRITDAREVFDGMSRRDVVSYTALVSAYAKSGRCRSHDEALVLFFDMVRVGIEPNEYTIVAVLTVCIRGYDCQLGGQVHALAIKKGCCSVINVSNALMGLYANCKKVDDAMQVFKEMPEKDVSSWNAAILATVNDCRYSDTFELFRAMSVEGLCGDCFSLSTLLTAASKGFSRLEGEAVHAYSIKVGLEVDLSVGNALMAFYTKAGCVEDVFDVFRRMAVRDVICWTGMLTGYMEFGLVEPAVEIFDQMPERNHITYNALMSGLCLNGQGLKALKVFQDIVESGVEVSDFTLTTAVSACGMVCDKQASEQIHAFVTKAGCGSSPWIEAALIDMCSRCGRMSTALKIFNLWSHDEDHCIAWTSMMCAYSRNGQPAEALSLLHAILDEEGLDSMDETGLATAFGICGTLGFLEMGKQIHSFVLRTDTAANRRVGNALFSMYSKCGDMENAIRVFNLMPDHDIVSWNALLSSHLLHRQGNDALTVWSKMERLGIVPNSISFASVLSSCKYTSSDSTDICRKLFFSMTGLYKIEPTTEHYAAFVDVLGYWGCFDEVEKLIKSMPFKPDASVWRTLLRSCRLRSNSSLGRQAMQQLLALEPKDPSTYILVSNLYSASGRWQCSEKVREEMRQKGLRKLPARSWIIHDNRIHTFYARDRSHPQYKDIQVGLDILILECLKSGYEPDTSFVLHEVEEHQKRHFLFYHSAKLAVMYGHLVTPLSKPISVRKSIRLCGDCHKFFKIVSSVTGREILFRDSTGFHLFRYGECSCGDYW